MTYITINRHIGFCIKNITLLNEYPKRPKEEIDKSLISLGKYTTEKFYCDSRELVKGHCVNKFVQYT